MKRLMVIAMLASGLMAGIVNADVIPLIRGVRGNHDIFVTFSDGSRASFLLDTGATITCLSPETFIRLASSGKVGSLVIPGVHILLKNKRNMTSEAIP